MKKQKGFTLIELLAIIVILAIIAVITVPIILNVIDNAKKGTAKDSAYGYKDAISKYYVSDMLEDESIKLSGDYNVVDGKLGEYDIPFSGTKPTSGYLTFENNALTSGCLTIDEYKVTFDKGEVTNVEVGECGSKVYKCKRADVSTLHTEECTQTSGGCYATGYTTDNKGTTITYGNKMITEGTLNSGDAFDCDINGDEKYEETEKFYYVSDLYNTTTKKYDDNYAVLIYYNNTTKGSPDNTLSGLITYNINKNDNNSINYEGPVSAKTNLPKVSQWSNISLSNTTRAIINQNEGMKSNNGTYTLPKEYSYEGYAARLITVQEINSACNITVGSYNNGELDNCNYLLENTKYSNSSLGTYGYWTESPQSGGLTVWTVRGDARFMNADNAYNSNVYGVRPVIEVLKTDIDY